MSAIVSRLHVLSDKSLRVFRELARNIGQTAPLRHYLADYLNYPGEVGVIKNMLIVGLTIVVSASIVDSICSEMV